jgi:hypothetical protein
MPLGLLTDDEFEREFSKKKIQVEVEESHKVEESPRGRSEGDMNVPDSLRQIIGETAVVDGRQAALKLANQFGISPSSVSAYANGATSTTTYDTPSKSIFSHINKSRARAIKRAQKTLNGALSAITQEKLDYSDAKDLSGIAKDMAVVIKNLEPEKVVDESAAKQTPQFVIYAPQFKQENSFEVIDVKE